MRELKLAWMCSGPTLMMRGIRVLGLMLLVMWPHAGSMAASREFFVAPDGSDANPGTLQLPFRTLERARDAVRSTSRPFTGDVVVNVRAGAYELATTLVLDQRDSGSDGFRVIYRAFPGEAVSLSGGQRITGWLPAGGGVYRASVGALRFRQLYVNGRRATRARTPNAGTYFTLRGWDEGGRRLQIARDEIAAWQRLNQVEMIVPGEGVNQANLRIASFSPSGTSAFVVPREPERTRIFQQVYPPKRLRPYFFENAREFVDEPGEWYLDTTTGELFYFPHPGEDLASGVVTAPRLETLVEIRGTLDAPVQDIELAGLTFEYSTWLSPSDTGFIGDQASTEFVQPLPDDEITSYPSRPLPAAIAVQAATRIGFERNVFRRLGASAVNLVLGVTDSHFTGNVITDVSGSGLSIDLHFDGKGSDPRKICRRVAARNNYITRVGQEYFQSVGIMLGYTDSGAVEHNEIHDTPYSGISVGWGWDDVANAARSNVVRYNDVHGTNTLMSDGAGIYTLSRQPGTLVAENYVHDIVRSPWVGGFAIAAIYLDEGSNLITVRDNVLLRNAQNIFQNGNGPSNTFVDNDGSSPATIANAGLEPAYRDIKPGSSPGPSGDLALAYGFDEGAGQSVTDASGNQRTASLIGGTSWTTGRFGSALLLDGTNDYVQVPLPGLPTADFTWSAWVWLAEIRAFQTIMEAQGTSMAELELNVTSTGALSVWMRGAELLTTARRVTARQWHYVTLQRSGSLVRVYVDGEPDSRSGTSSSLLNFSTCPLLIGVDADSGCTGSLNGHLSGAIDELRVYRRALGQAEIQHDMTTPVVGAGSDLPPVATALAFPTAGLAPLTVDFAGDASFDPDGQPLTFAWDFGDGASATTPNPVHTYQQAGQYTASLRVSDGTRSSLAAPLVISVGGPLEAAILEPAHGQTFRAGDVILFSGSAVDVNGRPLPATALSWTIVLSHDGHVHPVLGPVVGVTSGSFQVPRAGHDFSGNTAYEIRLSVTDAGQQATTSVTVLPEKVNLIVDSVPSGLEVILDGVPRTTPYGRDTVVGFQHELDAPPVQRLDEEAHTFSAWSDGGARRHVVTAPPEDASYVVTYLGGLIAAYAFNEGSGLAVGDSSGLGHGGVASGPTWTSTGRFGRALLFDGIDDWVTIPDSPRLDLSTGMTLLAWIYPVTASGVRDVVVKEGPGVDIYNLYHRNWRGLPEANMFVGGANRTAEGPELPANAWTHLAATYDGATLRLYLNGVPTASAPVSGPIPGSTAPLRIGGNSMWGEFFQGVIDEVWVFDRALTPSEIQQFMNTPVPGP
jgi:PKD repeat protein